MVSQSSVDDMSLFSPQNLIDPYPLYARLRQGPPEFDEALQGWLLSRHDNVARALAAPELSVNLPPLHDVPHFNSDQLRKRQDIRHMMNMWLPVIDPPQHTRLRKLMNHAFKPRNVSQMRPKIEQMVDELIANHQDGTMEFVDDFAFTLPIMVIADVLGVPKADRDLFKPWAQKVVTFFADLAQSDGAALEGMHEATQEFQDYFRDFLRRRRQDPRKDIISDLAFAEIDGERLSDEEIIASGVLILFAGHETTKCLLTNGLHALLSNRKALHQLRDKPNIVPTAIEELLRYDTAQQIVARNTSKPFQLRDIEIPAGQRMILLLGAGNRDPDIFDQPDQLNLERDPNPHLSFGLGRHICLGAPLARLELGIAFQKLSQLEGLELHETEPNYSFSLRGLNKMRISFRN